MQISVYRGFWAKAQRAGGLASAGSRPADCEGIEMEGDDRTRVTEPALGIGLAPLPPVAFR